jgi:hypothetical protein
VLGDAGPATALVAAAGAVVLGAAALEVDPAAEDVDLLWQAAVVSDSATTPAAATRRWVRMVVSP